MKEAERLAFLTKQRVKSNALVPQYYAENSHEAIIPREIFMQMTNPYLPDSLKMPQQKYDELL